MLSNNHIILSLGSNQGNRAEILQEAINLINDSIGEVVQISPIYETAAWGFESEDFYNCTILINSAFSAQIVLEKALEIERSLGRIRISSNEYSARKIDIDLITFNEEIIETATLSIPHPLLQDRKFVLKPASDLDTNWVHPILKKNFKELLQITTDYSDCKKIGNLLYPLNQN